VIVCHPRCLTRLTLYGSSYFLIFKNSKCSIIRYVSNILTFINRPRLVKERMLCYAIIGRAGGKELIMKVQINCEFISPLLQFSADGLQFRVDKVFVAAEDQYSCIYVLKHFCSNHLHSMSSNSGEK